MKCGFCGKDYEEAEDYVRCVYGCCKQYAEARQKKKQEELLQKRRDLEMEIGCLFNSVMEKVEAYQDTYGMRGTSPNFDTLLKWIRQVV